MTTAAKPAGKDTPNPEAEAAATAAADKAAADKAAADKAAADAAAAKGAEGTTDADKAAADKAAADKATADAAAAAAAERKAPEKYELKAPEGSTVNLAQVEAIAREYNLPNEDAQSMVEAAHAMTVKQSETWLSELKADKTYGGDKLEETQRLANAFLDKVRPAGTPRGDGLRKLMAHGVGNNLEVAALLADLGKMMREDGSIEGAPGGGDTAKTAADKLYPNAKS
jgi:hypothetical protein